MRTRLLMLGFVLAASTIANAQQAYRSGVTAFSRGRWQEAVASMKEAIGERTSESATTVLIYGTWYEPYVPHYYLGMALFKLGRCAEALPELAETQRQNVMPRKYSAGVEQALARCASSAVEPRPVPPAATTSSQPSVSSPPPAAPPVKAPEPVVITTTTEAPAVVEPSRAREASAPLAQSKRSLMNAAQRARKTLVAVPKTASPREAALLRSRLRRAESAALSGSADTVSAATEDLVMATDDLESWIRSQRGDFVPPPGLLAGVEAYLHGDYGASLSALNAATFNDARSQAQILLFRAAAAHALFLLGHSRDKELYARAVNDVVQYKRLQAKRSPDARVFSPAFVSFVERAGS